MGTGELWGKLDQWDTRTGSSKTNPWCLMPPAMCTSDPPMTRVRLHSTCAGLWNYLHCQPKKKTRKTWRLTSTSRWRLQWAMNVKPSRDITHISFCALQGKMPWTISFHFFLPFFFFRSRGRGQNFRFWHKGSTWKSPPNFFNYVRIHFHKGKL